MTAVRHPRSRYFPPELDLGEVLYLVEDFPDGLSYEAIGYALGGVTKQRAEQICASALRRYLRAMRRELHLSSDEVRREVAA